MRKFIRFILGIIAVIGFAYAGFEVINNITATGDITASGNIISTNGVLRQYNTWHAFGGFQLQTTVIDITAQSGRKMITNASGNLRTGLEAYGLTLSGDIMTVTNTGDYAGTLSISVSGPNNDDICIRLFNITSSGQMGYFICGTALGATNFMPLTLPLYLEDDAGDQFRMEVSNITNNADISVRSAVFYVHYLHD